MDDLSVAMETSFGLKDIEVIEEVNGESFPEEDSLRKGLEGLSA